MTSGERLSSSNRLEFLIVLIIYAELWFPILQGKYYFFIADVLAGILQPPFYHGRLATRYGGILLRGHVYYWRHFIKQLH